MDIQAIRKSPAYQRARANGYSITDAVEQMRSAAAFRAAAISTVRDASKKKRRII